jgi:hypothetical protein
MILYQYSKQFPLGMNGIKLSCFLPIGSTIPIGLKKCTSVQNEFFGEEEQIDEKERKKNDFFGGYRIYVRLRGFWTSPSVPGCRHPTGGQGNKSKTCPGAKGGPAEF